MTWRAYPGPSATAVDRHAARQRRLLLRDELARVRDAAVFWRNGLAALLVGLIGFGLVKGRTDVGSLTAPYGVLVGCLLLLALTTGALGAVLLLRAAHGRPASTVVQQTPPGAFAWGQAALDHREALRAARALTWGVVLAMACGATLTAAVGFTWYGPAADGPGLEVVTPSGTFCGDPRGTTQGRLTLRTAAGEVVVSLGEALVLRAVGSCPTSNAEK